MYKVIPNTLTISRIFLTFVFANLLYQSNHQVRGGILLQQAVIFSLLCATDIIDGKLARNLKCATGFGAVLDVTADVLFVMTSTLILNVQGKIPVWFTAIIVLKFIEFLLTSHFGQKSSSCPKHLFVFDVFGRVASALFIIVPGVACTLLYGFGNTGSVILHLLCYITAGLSIISSISRWNHFFANSNMKTPVMGRKINKSSYNLSK
jgi:CDP-diacylglycerol--glycerol-3-phosphate 3-phosphatidyltransferase